MFPEIPPFVQPSAPPPSGNRAWRERFGPLERPSRPLRGASGRGTWVARAFRQAKDSCSILVPAAFVWLLAVGLALAASFPALTGRIVDNAHVLSAATRAQLEAKLADLEQKSQIQLVVATVEDLGGDEIEPYANALFREWKLGTKEKNNGVLFLIAPKLRKMRIEVGYGLEATLTDAASKLIIANAAAPRFKKGDYDGGVTRAVEDIVTALTADAGEWKPKPAADTSPDDDIVLAVIFAVFIVFMIYTLTRRGRRTGGSWIVGSGGSSYSSGGGWSSGSSSGSSDSFSGGGGSSGGGGASGDW